MIGQPNELSLLVMFILMNSSNMTRIVRKNIPAIDSTESGMINFRVESRLPLPNTRSITKGLFTLRDCDCDLFLTTESL